MAKNVKYYVVWKGAKPGIYDSWKSCEAQVKGYPDARYKAFPSRAEAEAAFADGARKHVTRHSPASKKVTTSSQHRSPGIIKNSISVDAACSGNPGIMEYRGVHTDTQEELFHMGPFAQGTNNIGEFLALVHALAWLAHKGDNTTPIYSDSRIAQGWITGGKARTKLVPNRKNHQLFTLIERAEKWLKTHTWTNPILKWETERWGEIPADFGRK
ncbi:MAG TPA: ribonuclease H family protein [Saprospiraceae bacterium]|nr:ribonuclease H family protein [Saprospiraceae bacterium]